jgi:hypothetical protein
MRTALPVFDDAARSPDPSVCPFLRYDADGVLVTPLVVPDEGNRCVAIGSPRPQSLRQQELVCLVTAHADCPRYLRGALALESPDPVRRQTALPRATLAALLILVLSAGISFGFVIQRGGIDLPVIEAPSSTAVAIVATPSPAATPAATALATPLPTPTATVAASPSPSPSPSPTPSPAPTPSPTLEPSPKPTPKPTKAPTSTRYKLLKPCPNRNNCYIYVVRSGDNLYSIARYFGHSLTTIYKWNPQYPETRLRVGDEIRMPPPTR